MTLPPIDALLVPKARLERGRGLRSKWDRLRDRRAREVAAVCLRRMILVAVVIAVGVPMWMWMLEGWGHRKS
jgi:hypothetical protein